MIFDGYYLIIIQHFPTSLSLSLSASSTRKTATVSWDFGRPGATALPAVTVGAPVPDILTRNDGNLVGGLEHFLFSRIYGIILPIDVHICQDD